jgi:hypothetical protein
MSSAIDRERQAGGRTNMQVEDLKGWVYFCLMDQLLIILLWTSYRQKYAQNERIAPEYHIFEIFLTSLNVLGFCQTLSLHLSIVGLRRL